MWRDNVEEACSVLRAGAYSSGLEALGLHRWTMMVLEALGVVHSGNYSLVGGRLVLVKVKIVV